MTQILRFGKNCDIDALLPNIDFEQEDYALFFNSTQSKDVAKITERINPKYISSFTYAQEGTVSKKGGLKDEQLIGVADCLKEISSLTSLELEMCNNFITEKGIAAFTNSISSNTSLKKFKIAGGRNQLRDKGVVHLADAVRNFRELEWLDFCADMNNVGEAGITYFMQSIMGFKQLTYIRLCLRVNSIDDVAAQSIGRALLTLPNLTTALILLQNLDITDVGTKEIVEGLKSSTFLHTLVLNFSSNAIGSNGAKHIGNSLAYHQNLQNLELILDTCDIELDGLNLLTTGFQRLQKLNSLSMNVIGTTFGRKELERLAQDVSSIKGLLTFNLQIAQGFDETMANALNSIHKECLYLQSMTVLNIEQVGDDNPDFLYILLEHFSVRQAALNSVVAFNKLIQPELYYNPRHITCDLYEDI